MARLASPGTEPSFGQILIADDDQAFVRACARGFAGRHVHAATTVDAACAVVEHTSGVDLAIVDLRLGVDSGLPLVAALRRHPRSRDAVLIVLSGYLSVAFATRALELGADKALFKPATCSELLAAAADARRGTSELPIDAQPAPASLARAEWEHITRVLTDCDGNVSAAARSLGIHRQSLQRKLRKHAPRR
jgi:two-component system, response regulator RegA